MFTKTKRWISLDYNLARSFVLPSQLVISAGLIIQGCIILYCHTRLNLIRFPPFKDIFILIWQKAVLLWQKADFSNFPRAALIDDITVGSILLTLQESLTEHGTILRFYIRFSSFLTLFDRI